MCKYFSRYRQKRNRPVATALRLRSATSCRPSKIVLSLISSGTVQVWWMMNAKSVADHSRHVVRKLQNCVNHMLSFSFWAPSDLHVLLNEDNDGQCWQQPEHTFLSDKMELPPCRQTLVDNGTQLVHYSLINGQPVLVVTKCRCNMFIFPVPHDKSSTYIQD